MENQNDTNTTEETNTENMDIEDMSTLENNYILMRDRMSNVGNRIDKAITGLTNQKHEWVKEELTKKISILEAKSSKDDHEIKLLKKGNKLLDKIINEKKTVITSMELSIKHWLRRFEQVQIENADLSDKCSAFQESQSKAEMDIDIRQKEIAALREEVRLLKMKLDYSEQHMKLNPYEQENKSVASNIAQDNFVNVVCAMSQVIGTINKELLQEKLEKEQCIKKLEAKEIEVKSLVARLDAVARDMEEKVKEALAKAVVQADTFTVLPHENSIINISDSSVRDTPHNNADDTSDYTQSSMESSKIISYLQKTIDFKNSTITSLQSDNIYKDSLMAELENKLLNMTKKLKDSKINLHQKLFDVKKSPSLGW